MIGDNRSGNDYSLAPLIKPAAEELWRMTAAILQLAFLASKDFTGKEERNLMDCWKQYWAVGRFEFLFEVGQNSGLTQTRQQCICACAKTRLV